MENCNVIQLIGKERLVKWIIIAIAFILFFPYNLWFDSHMDLLGAQHYIKMLNPEQNLDCDSSDKSIGYYLELRDTATRLEEKASLTRLWYGRLIYTSHNSDYYDPIIASAIATTNTAEQCLEERLE